ncbi:MAG TPA: hypothetical protein PLS94_02910 [Prolixibacteraceae bacterium]|nr:hypothetical protein [Prolixibacteraceae bacterium]
MRNIKLLTVITLIAFGSIVSCTSKQVPAPVFENISSNSNAKGSKLEIKFLKGTSHNHPTFTIWVEDVEGNFIETLFVTRYLATGIYGHGSLGEGKWDNKPGQAQRPSTLPYWLHKKGSIDESGSLLPNPQHPMPDAITGATPKGDFILNTSTTKELPKKFRLMLEINQPWDWNEYWHNNLYPDDTNYKSSCQPALVYSVLIDTDSQNKTYYLNPIGHSHYSGKDGNLYTDLSTISSAKNIINKVSVSLK